MPRVIGGRRSLPSISSASIDRLDRAHERVDRARHNIDIRERSTTPPGRFSAAARQTALIVRCKSIRWRQNIRALRWSAAYFAGRASQMRDIERHRFAPKNSSTQRLSSCTVLNGFDIDITSLR